MAEPVDIQKKLDDWLASNESAQKYVSALYYLPEGTPVPPAVTHFVELQSATSDVRELVVGVVCTPETAIFVEMLLSMIATQPPV